MRNLILMVIGIVLFISCHKNNDLKEGDFKPEIPLIDSIDLNADHIYDFAIGYSEFATYDLPSSEGSIIGSIIPLNQNQLLYSNSDNYLFLDINDTIRKISNTNSEWNHYNANLICINRHYDKWDKTWTILTEQKSFYFLAYKLILSDSEKIGWISLDFNTNNGKISITDGVYADDNELIIQKKTTN